jgi:precorrin-3B synthase
VAEASFQLPFIKGWCPTVFEPMTASDGLLASLKPRVKGWTPAELRLIASEAQRHGSGALLLTNRANLQVRGLTAESAPRFAAAVANAALASADANAERRRNILTDASMAPELEALASQLENWLERETTLAALPPKFLFAVTAVERQLADICILAAGTQWYVIPDNADLAVQADEPLAAVALLTQAFIRLASEGQRMRDLIAEVGCEVLFREAGLKAVAFAPQTRIQPTSDVGVLDPQRFAIGVPFGRLDATRLLAIADLAARFAKGRVRLSAHRSFVITSLKADVIEALSAHAQEHGFIINAEDSRLRIAACSGGSGCGNSVVSMFALAESLAPFWRGQSTLHLSGCAKGCAHPRAAALTCVAEPTSNRFHILKNSRADGRSAFSLSAAELPQFLAQESLS